MCPLAHSDGRDAPRLIDELVPCEAAVIDDVVVRFEDAVRQPIVAHELPDIFNWIELGATGRKRHQGDVGRNDQFCGAVPSGLVESDHRMRPGRDVEGDLLEVHAHGLGVARWHDDPGSLALSGADCTEDPRRGSALIPGGRRPGAACGPSPGQLGLLADLRLVLT